MLISEYYDMPIYSDNARYVGKVQEVVLDIEAGEVLGLGFAWRGEKVTTIPYDNVVAVGDIILVESSRTIEKESGQE